MSLQADLQSFSFVSMFLYSRFGCSLKACPKKANNNTSYPPAWIFFATFWPAGHLLPFVVCHPALWFRPENLGAWGLRVMVELGWLVGSVWQQGLRKLQSASDNHPNFQPFKSWWVQPDRMRLFKIQKMEKMGFKSQNIGTELKSTELCTLPGTKISHPKAVGKVSFLSHWWDKLVPRRVYVTYMFNDSSDFRHERLERLIWSYGNFVDFLWLALLMSYSKTVGFRVFPIFSKQKRCGKLDILHFP